MYNLRFLNKENELNKILKVQKRTKHRISILFTSLWDNNSINLVNELKDKYKEETIGASPLYVVDSFTMPHSFVIYGTTKVPHLVKVQSDKVYSEDYYPVIREKLGLTEKKWLLTK